MEIYDFCLRNENFLKSPIRSLVGVTPGCDTSKKPVPGTYTSRGG